MRIIVGITGATGVIMAYYLLRTLRKLEDCEIHLVISDAGVRNWELETDMPIEKLTELAHHLHHNKNMAATISSGSFKTDGMIVLPCSMKTLAGITSGYSDNLVLRAVDVCLKENRKVVIAPREMPMGKIHLRNMYEASNLGCIIIPPMLTFYNDSDNLDKQINHIIGKILMQFDIQSPDFVPWHGVE